MTLVVVVTPSTGLAAAMALGGVAIFPAIPSRLQSSVVGVTPVDERIMLFRLKHTLGFMPLVAVYAPTKTSKLEEMFYAKLDFIVDQCPSRDTLVVWGDFSVVTGTERVGYALCVAKFRRLRIGGLLVSETRASPLVLEQ